MLELLFLYPVCLFLQKKKKFPLTWIETNYREDTISNDNYNLWLILAILRQTSCLIPSCSLLVPLTYLILFMLCLVGVILGWWKKKKWKIGEKIDEKCVWLKGGWEKIDGVLLFSLWTHQNWRENKNEDEERKLIGILDKINLPFWTKNWTSQCHAHKLIRSSPSHVQKIENFFFVFFLLAVHLATFKKFSFFFMYLGFFSRQIYLFI